MVGVEGGQGEHRRGSGTSRGLLPLCGVKLGTLSVDLLLQKAYWQGDMTTEKNQNKPLTVPEDIYIQKLYPTNPGQENTKPRWP